MHSARVIWSKPGRLLAAGLVAGLVAVLSVGPALSARADTFTIAPGVTPISVPGSLLASTRGGLTGSVLADTTAVQLYSLAKNREFWEAVAAVDKGTATPAAIELVQSTPKPAIPVTKFAGTMKLVNGVVAPVGAYLSAAQLTAGAMSFVGIDAKGTVCNWSSQNGVGGDIVAVLAGQSCEGYGPAVGYVPNADASAGSLSAWSCKQNDPTACARYAGVAGTMGQFGGIPPRYAYKVEVQGLSDSQVGIVFSYGSPGAVEQSSQWAYKQPAGSWYDCGGVGLTSGYCASALFLSSGPVEVTGFKIDGSAGGFAPVQTSTGNPDRQLCTTAVTMANVEYTRCTEPYREGDEGWKPPLAPEVPEGEVLKSLRVDERGNGAPKTLQEENTTDEYRDLAQLAPECFESICLVDLTKLGAGGKTVSCLKSPNDCAGWFEDPAKEDVYTCSWGGHVVPLSNCTPYAPTFKPGTLTGPDTLGDPITGEPLPNPSPSPGTGTGTVPNPDGSSSNCFAAGWADAPNPVEWVFVPLKCALQWAFVPSQKKTEINALKIKNSWNSTPPGRLIATVGTWNIAPNVSSCGGIPYDFPIWGDTHWTGTLLDSCTPPLDALASWGKLIASALLIGGSVLAVVRMIAGVIGYQGIGGSGGER